jgi:hypothetical protein
MCSPVQLKVLRENIDIRVTTFQWVKETLVEANAFDVGFAAIIAALAGIFTAIGPARS